VVTMNINVLMAINAQTDLYRLKLKRIYSLTILIE